MLRSLSLVVWLNDCIPACVATQLHYHMFQIILLTLVISHCEFLNENSTNSIISLFSIITFLEKRSFLSPLPYLYIIYILLYDVSGMIKCNSNVMVALLVRLQQVGLYMEDNSTWFKPSFFPKKMD